MNYRNHKRIQIKIIDNFLLKEANGSGGKNFPAPIKDLAKNNPLFSSMLYSALGKFTKTSEAKQGIDSIYNEASRRFLRQSNVVDEQFGKSVHDFVVVKVAELQQKCANYIVEDVYESFLGSGSQQSQNITESFKVKLKEVSIAIGGPGVGALEAETVGEVLTVMGEFAASTLTIVALSLSMSGDTRVKELVEDPSSKPTIDLAKKIYSDSLIAASAFWAELVSFSTTISIILASLEEEINNIVFPKTYPIVKYDPRVAQQGKPEPPQFDFVKILSKIGNIFKFIGGCTPLFWLEGIAQKSAPLLGKHGARITRIFDAAKGSVISDTEASRIKTSIEQTVGKGQLGRFWERFKTKYPILIRNNKIQTNFLAFAKSQICQYIFGWVSGVVIDIATKDLTEYGKDPFSFSKKFGWTMTLFGYNIIIMVCNFALELAKLKNITAYTQDFPRFIGSKLRLYPEEGPVDNLIKSFMTLTKENETLKDIWPEINSILETKKIDFTLKVQQFANKTIEKYNMETLPSKRKNILEKQNLNIDKKIEKLKEYKNLKANNKFAALVVKMGSYFGFEAMPLWQAALDKAIDNLQQIKSNNEKTISSGDFSKQIPYVDWVKADPTIPRSIEAAPRDTPNGFDGSEEQMKQINFTEKYNPLYNEFMSKVQKNEKLKVEEKQTGKIKSVFKLYGRDKFSVYLSDQSEGASRYSVKEYSVVK